MSKYIPHVFHSALGVFLACIFFIMPSQNINAASIRLDNVIVHFENGTSTRKDVEVTNTSQETAYVSVTVYEMVNPGTKKEITKTITNPEDITLLVTPNKVIIPPGGQASIRLMNIAPPGDNERIYRLKVAPVEGEVKAEETGVKVIIAYGVLVIVEPSKPKPILVYSKKGLKVKMENKGNSNVLLNNGRVCPLSKDKSAKPKKETLNEENGCQKLEARRLYSGNKWKFELPFDGEVTFNKITRGKNERISIQ